MSIRRSNVTKWENQDPLGLAEEEWLSLLSDPDIFDESGLAMINFVYSQHNHQSSATEIGMALGGVTQQQVTAWNRGVAKRIYKKLFIDPPYDGKGKGGGVIGTLCLMEMLSRS